jgi:hypothetical protein
MNKIAKSVLIVLLVIFLIWTGFVLLFGGYIGGCPPAYDVQKIYTPDSYGPEPACVVHITDEDLVLRPYLKEAFEDEKRIILPVGHPIDFIPGNFFGPKYATHRMPLSDRGDFLNTIATQRNNIWEHNGTYIRFTALAC